MDGYRLACKLLSPKLLSKCTASRRSLSSLRSIRFPVEHTTGQYPSTLLCHGLGSAWDLPAHLEMQEYVRRKGFAFTRFQYREVGNLEEPWQVDMWIEDIIQLLDLFYPQMGPQILVAASAGAMAALRAALERPEMVESMLLLAPGVGIDLSYMERIVPGSVKLLKAGKAVIHPGLKGGYDHLVTLDPLMSYIRKCPVNTMDSVPLSCPVRIIHGITDGLVDYKNSLKLAEKIESTDVQVKLSKRQGHVFKTTLDVRLALDDLLAEAQRAKFADKPADVHVDQQRQSRVNTGSG